MPADPKLSIVAPELGRRDRITPDRVRDEGGIPEHLRRELALEMLCSDGAQRASGVGQLGGGGGR